MTPELKSVAGTLTRRDHSDHGVEEIVDDQMLEQLRDAGFEVVHVGPTLEHHHAAITLVGSSGGMPIGTMRQDDETGLWTLTPHGGGVSGGAPRPGEEARGERGRPCYLPHDATRRNTSPASPASPRMDGGSEACSIPKRQRSGKQTSTIRRATPQWSARSRSGNARPADRRGSRSICRAIAPSERGEVDVSLGAAAIANRNSDAASTTPTPPLDVGRQHHAGEHANALSDERTRVATSVEASRERILLAIREHSADASVTAHTPEHGLFGLATGGTGITPPPTAGVSRTRRSRLDGDRLID